MDTSILRSNCNRTFLTLALFACICMVCIMSCAQQPLNTDLFAQGKFTEARLKGLDVRLGEPVEVTAQIGWHMIWPHHDTWAFIHLTPLIARFPDGELIVTYTLDPDTYDNPVYISGFQISKDGGEHWGLRYSVIMQHMTMILIPAANDSLVLLPSETMGQTPGDGHNFRGPYIRFEHGGKRMVMEPGGVRIVDWPWPVQLIPGVEPRRNWHYWIRPSGNALKAGNQMLATVQWEEKGEHLHRLALIASKDGGHTWQYYSTIAIPGDIFPQKKWEEMHKKGFEGPSEVHVIQLEDGELMAVFRVGSGRQWNLRRCYSRDEGHTWSKPDVLPAYSVEPEMLRIDNGTILLATGRPGIHLWLSADPRSKSWQDVDVVAYHNKWAPNASYRIDPLDPRNPNGMWQTSSYTGLVQIAPNRVLLVYDRDPERAPAGPDDLSRVFVMPIEVQRR